MKNKKLLMIGAGVVLLGAVVAFTTLGGNGKNLTGDLSAIKLAQKNTNLSIKPLTPPPPPPLSNDSITRAELMKLVVVSAGWPINTSGGPHFSDVPVNSWFYPYVETAYNNFVTGGYPDGTYKPTSFVNRAEGAKVFYLAFLNPCNSSGLYQQPYYQDVNAQQWYYQFVTKIADCKMVDIQPGPSSKFFPSDLLTKGRAQTMIDNAKKAGWIK